MRQNEDDLGRCAVRRPDDCAAADRRPRWRRFRRDEAGATTVEFVVVTAKVVGLAAAVTAGVTSGAQTGADKLAKCLKIQGKLMSKDLSYEQRQKRIKKRCAKL